MLYRSACFVVMLSVLGGGEPSSQPVGACIAPNGSPCRTLVYEKSWWPNLLERHHERLTEAVRRDGGAMLRVSHRGLRFFVFPFESYDRTRIVLPTERKTFEIERTAREVREMPGLWDLTLGWLWHGDPDCAMAAAHAGKVEQKSADHRVVAGIDAIEYLYRTRDHRSIQTLAFAPSLGCTAVEWQYSIRNGAGLTIQALHLVLVSATLGEPDGRLFAIPNAYKPMRADNPWRYISLNTFPGDIQVTLLGASAMSSAKP